MSVYKVPWDGLAYLQGCITVSCPLLSTELLLLSETDEAPLCRVALSSCRWMRGRYPSITPQDLLAFISALAINPHSGSDEPRSYKMSPHKCSNFSQSPPFAQSHYSVSSKASGCTSSKPSKHTHARAWSWHGCFYFLHVWLNFSNEDFCVIFMFLCLCKNLSIYLSSRKVVNLDWGLLVWKTSPSMLVASSSTCFDGQYATQVQIPSVLNPTTQHSASSSNKQANKKGACFIINRQKFYWFKINKFDKLWH